jgi:FtsZ-binding cell division protein ZapB
VDTEQLLQMEITILKAENRSLRASLAWTERALHLHGPDTARQTIRRARATSDRHRQDRVALWGVPVTMDPSAPLRRPVS